ncbi:A24 family peptidase [Azospirillum sp. sgz301742]
MNELFLIAASALLVVAAAWDVRSYRIPNTICAGLAVLFVFRSLAIGPPFPFSHLVTAALAFAAGFVLFARNLMGGGDVKLLAAAVLWIPPALVPAQITWMAMAGGVFAALLLAARGVAQRFAVASGGEGALPLLLQHNAPVPYGVAIAVGTLAYLPMA